MKIGPLNSRPEPDVSRNLKFISKNVYYPGRPIPGEKDVKLERIITRVGGTQGEIDAVSHIRFMKMIKLNKR